MTGRRSWRRAERRTVGHMTDVAALEAALAYASRGWHVFPLRAGSKAPATSNGHLDATTDEAVIRQWWTSHPDRGIGIAVKASGLVVVDVDPRNGGDDTFADLEMSLGPLPDCPRVRTGGGGTHVYLAAQSGVDLPGSLGAGVDLKSDGYVVAPPSGHPSGEHYQWWHVHGARADLRPMPDAWRMHAQTRRQAVSEASSRPIDADPDDFAAGIDWTAGRNNGLTIVAGRARSAGADVAVVLEAVNDALPDPLPRGEVARIARNAMRWEEGDGSRVVRGDWPFPTDHLPRAMRDLVRESAKVIGCPEGMVALPAIVAASVAIGATREVDLGDGWTETPAVWGMVVAPPSTGKTPAQRHAWSPIRSANSAMQAANDKARDDFEAALADWQALPKADRGPKPERPGRRALIVDDFTLEALAVMLASNPRGMVIGKDEIITWAAGMDKYRAGRGGDEARFLELWNGQPWAIDRKTSDGVYIERPFLSLYGTVQPAILKDVSTKDNGLLERFLVSVHEQAPAMRRRPGVHMSGDTVARWEACLGRLLALRPDGAAPATMRLCADADAAWQDEDDRNADAIDECGPADNARRAILGKAGSHAARLAAIFTLVANPDAREVTAEAVRAAWHVVRHFQGQVGATRAAMSAKPQDVEADALLKWLRKQPNRRASMRDIARSRVVGSQAKSDAERVVARLVDRDQAAADTGARGTVTVRAL